MVVILTCGLTSICLLFHFLRSTGLHEKDNACMLKIARASALPKGHGAPQKLDRNRGGRTGKMPVRFTDRRAYAIQPSPRV